MSCRPGGRRWRAARAAGLPALMGLAGIVGVCAGCDGTPPPGTLPSRFDYPATAAAACPAGGPADAAQPAAEPDGAPTYQVRTPSNYDARVAHPLLVVYAAAGASAAASERFTRLTTEATSRGFVVAYVDHRPMRLGAVVALGGVARSVARRWCVDLQRVALAGHSDGGTVSTALALLPATRDTVGAIAVSAAGFSKADLMEMKCRAPIPVMVMHGAQDTLFPGWGRDAARWWARCNGCAATASAPDASGCAAYTGCAPGGPVLHCEGPQGHTQWPGLQSRIVDFLLGPRA